jgi:adenosylhomocysteine nucleosidase
LETEKIKAAGRDVISAKINGNDVYVIESGCGEIDAASATEALISVLGAEAILNYGVVGALKEDLAVSDLFLVEKVVHYDFDTSPIDVGVKPHQYAGLSDEFLPTDKGLSSLALTKDPTLKKVILASGDKFIADVDAKKALAGETGASICDMEGAAIARVSFIHKVPCLIIKCISDGLYGDGSDYEKNVKASSARAFSLLKKILLSL